MSGVSRRDVSERRVPVCQGSRVGGRVLGLLGAEWVGVGCRSRRLIPVVRRLAGYVCARDVCVCVGRGTYCTFRLSAKDSANPWILWVLASLLALSEPELISLRSPPSMSNPATGGGGACLPDERVRVVRTNR